MNNFRMMLAGAISSLLFAACAGTPRSPEPSGNETRRETTITRSVLMDSSKAARAYGQGHLGHFLDLDVKGLRREGLQLPASVSLRVRTTHTSFCIVAANEALPSIHPWARASVSSRDPSPSSHDGCKR